MTCPYCGAQNAPGFQFCKTCGAKLAAKPAAPQQPQYQAPQQPQYQAPRQPQYQAPVATAPKKNPFEGLIKKIKSIDFGALLKDPKKLIIPAAAVAAGLGLVILISVISAAGGKAVTPETSY